MTPSERPVSHQALSLASASLQLKHSQIDVKPSPQSLQTLSHALGQSLLDLQRLKDNVCGTEEFATFVSKPPEEVDATAVGSQGLEPVETGKLKDDASACSKQMPSDLSWDALSNLSSDLDSEDESEQTPIMVMHPGEKKRLDRNGSLPSFNRWPSSVVGFVVGPGNDVVLAHKEIVAGRCPRLIAPVDREEAAPSSPLVLLPELTKPGIWACLNLLYTGGVQFAAEDALEVLHAARHFDLGVLADASSQVILESVSESNAWAMLESGLLLQSQSLIDTALEMIAAKTKFIVANNDFTSPSITAGALLKVVKRSDLTIYEKDLARVIVSQWMESTKEPKEDVNAVLRHISWPQVYEEDMELLSSSMRKQLLPDDVIAEVNISVMLFSRFKLTIYLKAVLISARWSLRCCSGWEDLLSQVEYLQQ